MKLRWCGNFNSSQKARPPPQSCAVMSEADFVLKYDQGEEAMLRTYLEVVKYLRQTYTANEGIAKADGPLTRYIQLSTVSLEQYAEAATKSP